MLFFLDVLGFLATAISVRPTGGLTLFSTRPNHLSRRPLTDLCRSDREYLVLLNRGVAIENATHWSLFIDGRMQLSLPSITLLPSTNITLHIGDGNQTDTDIYLGYTSPVLEDAGKVGLLDELGSPVIERKYP